MDRRSKSDPFVVVKWKTDTDDTWKEVGESPSSTIGLHQRHDKLPISILSVASLDVSLFEC